MKLIRSKKWIVIGGAVILVAAAAAVTAMNAGVAVESDAVGRGEVTKLIKESGTVESESSITLTARNSGEIKGLMVEEGKRVKAGDPLMTSDGTSAKLDIKSQQAELSGLQAQYSQARELANKNKALYEQGALSYADYTASNTAAKQLAAQISALQYSIESYSEASGAAGVTAPVEGVLTGVFVKEGESVAAGTPLFEISNLDDIYVKTDVIAEDADLIHEGDPVRIYNEDAGFFDENGTVRKIHLKAENKMSDLGVNQKRVTVEISFGEKETVRLGSNMDIEITIEQKKGVLRVSDLAVFEKEGKNCVYVIEGSKAVLREVETGLEGEDYLEVIAGLSDGDLVILSPNDDISEGVRIKTQEQ
ncbi:MAG: efflux RND transporter periplasmic adaptor subunit [Eubacteriales bacterium]|nr:efflux RND transporter periplasmic adaptor subunit [Eubacteriales bacterium]